MIYFLAEHKRYKKIHLAMFIYLIIKLSLVFVYTFATYKYTRAYVYSDFIINGKYADHGFFAWQAIKFIFFYVPRSLHGLVIFLYCLEWKFRIRYFWKCKFIEYLHDASLLRHYKQMLSLMNYQLFWIKGWMAVDFLAMSIAIWYWLWIWFQYSKIDNLDTPIVDLIIEGLGYIFYHAMGFILTWLTAASITNEADDLYKCSFQILQKLNEQHFTQCFKTDGFDVENNEKLVDYHQIDLNQTTKTNIPGLYHRKSTTYNNTDDNSINGSNDINQQHEESWKSLINNKNIIWEEWIYMNNVDVNNIKDEMKRSCLIKQLQTFILYYNANPCVFKLIITIRYATLFKIICLFAVAKLVDYLWSFTTIIDN